MRLRQLLHAAGSLWEPDGWVARCADAAAAADTVFVACASQVQASVLEAAQALAVQALRIIPATTEQTARIFTQLADESERRASEEASVLAQSVPPAARRTAAIVSGWGEGLVREAERAAGVIFGGGGAEIERRRARQRDMGRRTAALVNEHLVGLQAARALHAQARVHRTDAASNARASVKPTGRGDGHLGGKR